MIDRDCLLHVLLRLSFARCGLVLALHPDGAMSVAYPWTIASPLHATGRCTMARGCVRSNVPASLSTSVAPRPRAPSRRAVAAAPLLWWTSCGVLPSVASSQPEVPLTSSSWEVPRPLQDLSQQVGLRRLEMWLEKQFGLQGRNWGTYWVGFTDGTLLGSALAIAIPKLVRVARGRKDPSER